MRNIKNIPVFFEDTVEMLGRVDRAVLGDDYRLLYLVVNPTSGDQVILFKNDFILTEESVMIWKAESMKSYAHGEELSVYERKIGDRVYSSDGRELGIVSDFVLNLDEKNVQSVEISSGAVRDFLDGRLEVPLDEIRWASHFNVVANIEGSEIE